MNLIFVEDREYAKSFASLVSLDLPEAKVLFEGGVLKDAEKFFAEFRPTPREKNIIVTAGTMDSEHEEAGSAFDLVAEWLARFHADLEKNGNLAEFNFGDLAVVANPAFERRLEHDFISYRHLDDVCHHIGVTLFQNIKTSGPEELLKIIIGLDTEITRDFPGRRR